MKKSNKETISYQGQVTKLMNLVDELKVENTRLKQALEYIAMDALHLPTRLFARKALKI